MNGSKRETGAELALVSSLLITLECGFMRLAQPAER